jgi:hypothetical protein
LPPQSTSVSSPFHLPSLQETAWQTPSTQTSELGQVTPTHTSWMQRLGQVCESPQGLAQTKPSWHCSLRQLLG